MDDEKDLQEDNGFFTFDNNYPPFFIKPPSNQEKDCKESMQGIVTQYLQESYKDGIKHPDAILRNGLSAGEAGMIYFRELNEKRKKSGQEDDIVYSQHLIRVIAEALNKHMNINVYVSPFKDKFQTFINNDLFDSAHCKKKVMPAIKMFLNSTNMKTKGYTAKLRLVMADVEQSFSQSV